MASNSKATLVYSIIRLIVHVSKSYLLGKLLMAVRVRYILVVNDIPFARVSFNALSCQ